MKGKARYHDPRPFGSVSAFRGDGGQLFGRHDDRTTTTFMNATNKQITKAT